MSGPDVAVADAATEAKKVATLIARAALAGYELVHLGGGTFIARRWNLLKSLDHTAAVESFLQRVGAPE